MKFIGILSVLGFSQAGGFSFYLRACPRYPDSGKATEERAAPTATFETYTPTPTSSEGTTESSCFWSNF